MDQLSPEHQPTEFEQEPVELEQAADADAELDQAELNEGELDPAVELGPDVEQEAALAQSEEFADSEEEATAEAADSAPFDTAEPGADSSVADEASAGFITLWSTLVSTTNWEKGRIIHEWRGALIDAGAGPQQYSDEAWTRRVGGVSGQHVGRLRRVWERFGQIRETFTGVYWSHFQAALDWEDAELWLEGAAQNRWSVSQMRNQRWEAYGAPADLKPRDEDIVATDMDEDFSASSDGQQLDGSASVVQDYDGAGSSEAPYGESDFGEENGDLDAPFAAAADSDEYNAESSGEPTAGANRALERPLEDLPALPEDLADAFEQMKLAIVRHRMADWVEVSPQSVAAALAALQKLVKLDD